LKVTSDLTKKNYDFSEIQIIIQVIKLELDFKFKRRSSRKGR